VFGQEKKYDSAKLYFRRALSIKPDYKPASNNIIKIFKEQNQSDSITYFMKSSSLFDINSTTFMNDLGMAFFDQKRYDSARWYIQKAIQKDPGNAQLHSNLGLVFQGMNDVRVLPIESEEIVAGVKKNNVPVEYVTFADEGHGFIKKENQVTTSNKTVEFLDKYLKGDGFVPNKKQ